MWFANSKNIAIGVLGAAVVGLGSWVAVDHLASPATAQTASLTASSSSRPTTPGSWASGQRPSFGHFGFAGGFAAFGSMSGELKQIQADIGLPASTIFSDLSKGETLAQIAGSHAAKVESDIDSAIHAQLNKLVGDGAINSSQESQLYSDAQNAVSVFMNMKLSALAPHKTG